MGNCMDIIFQYIFVALEIEEAVEAKQKPVQP